MKTLIVLFIGMYTLLYSSENHQNLIDMLVSSNPATTGDWSEELPDNWSDDEQVRVIDVYLQIVKMGKPIVPTLIRNINRQEFSRTMSTSVPYAPLSVGNLCYMAISDLYDPVGMRYKSRKVGDRTLVGRPYFSALDTPEQFQVWWALAKDMKIADVREKIKQWYIERELEFGFNDDDERDRIMSEIERR